MDMYTIAVMHQSISPRFPSGDTHPHPRFITVNTDSFRQYYSLSQEWKGPEDTLDEGVGFAFAKWQDGR
jgi:hypothetical protein